MNARKMGGAFPDSLRQAMHVFGQDIAAARKARNLSQQQLAERVGISRMTLSRLERGDTAIGFDTVLCTAWVMGLEERMFSTFAPKHDPVQLRHGRLSLPDRVRAAEAATSHDLDF